MPRLTLDQVYNTDILNALAMEDMWMNRTPPTPLEYDKIVSEKKASPKGKAKAASKPNGVVVTTENPASLKDQRELSLREHLELFVSRYLELIRYM